MRDATNITLEELIIHIVDPQGQGLVLSSIPLPLAKNPALSDYFINHIAETLKSQAIKPARFRNVNPEQPSGVCRALLRQETTLVEGSQKLAQALFAILEQDRRITAGDLAVCLFQAENYPYTRFLAIMKIDPSQIFRHVVLKDSRGNTYVSFEPDVQAFTRERLQKCAIIQPLEPRHPDFDMLLLDRQVGGAEDARIARFFSEAFLDARESFDAHKYTDNLYRGLVRAENALRPSLTPQEEESLEAGIRSAFTARHINVDRWLEELPVSSEVKQKIDQTIRHSLPAREFSLDTKFSQRLIEKVKYRGDSGLRLEMDAENYHTLVVSEEHVTDDPDRPPYYRIVIETETWRKIT